MSIIEGRKIGQYGLPLKQGLVKLLWLGLWIGFLASSATVLIIYLLHGAADREPYDSWHDDFDVGGCLGRSIFVYLP